MSLHPGLCPAGAGTETRFIYPMHSKTNAQMPRFASGRRFIHKAAKLGDGRTDLKSTSSKIGFKDIYGMKRKGKVIGGKEK